jgi:histidinol-phosphate aminotransferase
MIRIEDVLALARPSLQTLKPYSSARDEFDQATSGTQDMVFLDANENPYPSGLNRYPDPHQRELKRMIAKLKDVAEDRIFLGNGSDEAIDLILRVFCSPNLHNVVIPSPTYGMYAVSAAINDITVKMVPLTPAFELDANAVMDAIDDKTRIVFLCSPNNPSGNLLSREAVNTVLKGFSGLVVMDEAYIDFTNTQSMTKVLDEQPNLIVLQTLSKAWGLAGLRLGMAFADPAIIALVNKIKPPYNISSPSQRLAMNSIGQLREKELRVKEILEERERVTLTLAGMKCVFHVYPSQANFLLVKLKEAGRAYTYLVQKGVVVRDRSQVQLCEDCLRITIGTPRENDQLLSALSSYE